MMKKTVSTRSGKSREYAARADTGRRATLSVLIVLVSLLSGCTSPLSEEEQAYFDAIYEIRDKQRVHYYSWDLLDEKLHAVNAPAGLAGTHDQLLNAVSDVTATNDHTVRAFDDWLMTIINSSSTNKQKEAGDAFNAAVEARRLAIRQFQLTWRQAEDTWDALFRERDLSPVPQATSFPLPTTKSTPVAFGEWGSSVFGPQVMVESVDFDAWGAIMRESEADQHKAPKPGERCIMVRVTLTNKSNERIWASDDHFTLYVNNRIYDEAELTNPNDLSSVHLEIGDSVSGNVSFVVPVDTEREPVLLYLEGDIAMALQ